MRADEDGKIGARWKEREFGGVCCPTEFGGKIPLSVGRSASTNHYTRSGRGGGAAGNSRDKIHRISVTASSITPAAAAAAAGTAVISREI